MTRVLIPTTRFERSLKRVLKRQPQAEGAIDQTLARLAEDAFDPRLKTHKLQGHLANFWSCTVAYDLRILLEFTTHGDAEAVGLIDIGTHDEVY